ncbi:1846_t:CDS:2, partial [Acaulospora morrowiae]
MIKKSLKQNRLYCQGAHQYIFHDYYLLKKNSSFKRRYSALKKSESPLPKPTNSNCKCLSCTLPDFKNSYRYNKDEQNLFLQICKTILTNIQLGKTTFKHSFNGEKKQLIHRSLENANIEQIIDNEFRNLFDLKTVNSREYKYTSDVDDAKTLDELVVDCKEINQPLLENILRISHKWYHPFTGYLKSQHKQQRQRFSKFVDINPMEQKLKRQLIFGTNKFIPGFKYLFQNEWYFVDNQSQFGQGDLIFASDFGVLMVVEVKNLNTGHGKQKKISRKISRRAVKMQAERYKQMAIEKFENMNVIVIGAYFTNVIDWEKNFEESRIFFTNEIDEMIAESVKNLDRSMTLRRRAVTLLKLFGCVLVPG